MASYRPEMSAPDRPYLTIILTGRNDNFGGDFNERLFRALAFNHRELTAAGVEHEFLFVEWRPVPGVPFLASLLREAFTSLRDGQLVSYIVDGRYHDAYSLNPKLQFQEFIAKNVGIRHARGEYILTTNTDIYLGREMVARLGRREFEPGVLYRAVRVDLASTCSCAEMQWDVLEDVRNQETVNEIRPPCYTNASGDFLMLDQETYRRLGGFNEVYRVAKVHMDSNFCLKAYTAGVPIRAIDAPVYHVGEGTLNTHAPLYKEKPGDAPWGDARWRYQVIYENDDGWGLRRAAITPLGDYMHFVEFDWAVVPPMVQLRRVVMPVARQGQASVL